jgi:hypothetical protein
MARKEQAMSDRDPAAPDPIRDLENFSLEGDPVHPLPASEVRRRGDRMRRRRTGALAAGAAAAVAVIATSTVVAAQNLSRSEAPPVGPSPSATESPTAATADWLDRVPDEFPLAEGWPEPGSAGGGEATVDPPGQVMGPNRTLYPLQLDVCGKEVGKAPLPEDRVTAVLDQTYARWREVRLFPDDTVAQAHFNSVRDAYAACPRYEKHPGATLHEVSDLDLGDDAFWVADTYDVGGGELANDVGLLYVVRVGNAVLIEDGSDRGPEVAPVAAEHLTQLAPPVDAMCVFSANLAPCQVGSESTSADADPGADIPDDFPLDRELRGAVAAPSHGDIGVMPVELCDRGDWTSEPDDRLTTRGLSPNRGDSRELALFPDSTSAVAAVAELRSALADCRKQTFRARGGNETVVRNTPLTLSLDYDHVSWSREAGSDFADMVIFVRVGRAVLLVHVTADGKDASPVVRDLLESTANDLAPEMCIFTEAGC